MVPYWNANKVVVWGGEVTWSRRGGLLRKSNTLYEQRGKVVFRVIKYAEPGKGEEKRLIMASTDNLALLAAYIACIQYAPHMP